MGWEVPWALRLEEGSPFILPPFSTLKGGGAAQTRAAKHAHCNAMPTSPFCPSRAGGGPSFAHHQEAPRSPALRLPSGPLDLPSGQTPTPPSTAQVHGGEGKPCTTIQVPSTYCFLLRQCPYLRAINDCLAHVIVMGKGFSAYWDIIVRPHLLVRATTERWVSTLVATSGSYWVNQL